MDVPDCSVRACVLVWVEVFDLLITILMISFYLIAHCLYIRTILSMQHLTRCLHFTACCTTGWVNYANEPSQAALERSSQDAYDVIRLTRSKAAVWTVDDVARLIEF